VKGRIRHECSTINFPASFREASHAPTFTAKAGRAFFFMSKRFTETRKWQDTWFMDLPIKYKLAWFWVLDNCDHAGLIDANPRLMSFMVGEPIDGEEFLRIMAGRVTKPKPGKWFISSFIHFQYGDELSARNSAHRGVLRILKDQEIDCPVSVLDQKEEGPTKDLASPSVGDKDKDKDQAKDKFKAEDAETPLVLSSSEFRAAWADWCAYRRERGQTLKSRTAKAQLAEMADWGQADAIAAIRKSILQGWQGVFKPDPNQRKTAQESEFANAF
jgi:hypothetical protein